MEPSRGVLLVLSSHLLEQQAVLSGPWTGCSLGGDLSGEVGDKAHRLGLEEEVSDVQ